MILFDTMSVATVCHFSLLSLFAYYLFLVHSLHYVLEKIFQHADVIILYISIKSILGE